jgi:hypothetical protein
LILDGVVNVKVKKMMKTMKIRNINVRERREPTLLLGKDDIN